MKKIMIVDDDKDVRDVVDFVLSEEGFQTLAVENGKEALDLLLSLEPENFPDLIIVDNLMPVMNGVEFILTIKRKHGVVLGEIPIAFSSAFGEIDPELREFPELLSLHKPMELEDLLALVKEAPAKSRGAINLDSIGG